MNIWARVGVFCFAGIQASPPQKPEKKEAPAPAQSSPLQGQSVLSFSPSRTASSSPKFSPSCVPGYSPTLSNPSPTNSAGGPFSPSVSFGKVLLTRSDMSTREKKKTELYFLSINDSPCFRCWTTVHPLAPLLIPLLLGQQKAPVWGLVTAHLPQCLTPLEARRTTWRIWEVWRGSCEQRRKGVIGASLVGS